MQSGWRGSWAGTVAECDGIVNVAKGLASASGRVEQMSAYLAGRQHACRAAWGVPDESLNRLVDATIAAVAEHWMPLDKVPSPPSPPPGACEQTMPVRLVPNDQAATKWVVRIGVGERGGYVALEIQSTAVGGIGIVAERLTEDAAVEIAEGLLNAVRMARLRRR